MYFCSEIHVIIMKNRKIATYLQQLSHSGLGRIIVLTGARQTGKTTLSRACFPAYTYLSIEDPVQREAYLRLNAAQWENLYPQAILDEVQKEPVLVESVKSVYDQYPAPRYVLLGSSQLLLLQKVRESLAGRCVIVEIFPLTLPELATASAADPVLPSFFQRYLSGEITPEQLLPSFTLDPQYAVKQKAFDFYLRYGGYPALTDEALTDKEKREWLQMYVKTFLERDVRDLASFRDLDPFIRLQRYVGHITAELANYSSISKEAGVSVPTVQRYIQYLEISYQALVLQPWHANPLKKLVKSPKLHFLDHGVLKAVLQKDGPPTGNEFESALVAEMYKQIKNARLPVSCYHLRTQDGREVDLLLETNEGYLAIEIKQTERAGPSDARHLQGLQDLLDKPLLHAFVLSNDPHTRRLGDNITALHAAAFLG